MTTQNPKFVLKPNIKSALLPTILPTAVIFIVLMIGTIIGSIVSGAFFLPFTFFIGFVVLGGFQLIPTYFDLRRREYRFFSDRLEYVDGWIVVNRHVVPYKKVTDMVLRKGIWNRMMNTGTVVLITAGSVSGQTQLVHIDNPDQIYDHLQKDILKM